MGAARHKKSKKRSAPTHRQKTNLMQPQLIPQPPAQASLFLWQWTFWRNTLMVVAALFAGWAFGALQIKPIADVNISQNRQMKLQLKNLNEQLSDYQTLEQIQQEALADLRAGNEALQAKLAALEQDLQHYRALLAGRN